MERYLISAACAVFYLLAEIAQICMCANSSMSLPCIQKEKEALLRFKASFNDPYNWSRLSSWEGNHCCQWEGISCHNVTSHVVMLDLINPCSRLYKQGDDDKFDNYRCVPELYSLLAQNVDPSLSELEYLSYLDLSGIDFQFSPIPIFIASMQSLTYLSLSDANFRGRIPSSLGNLTNLHLLDLSYNPDLQISQSNDINWISRLQSLEHLDLSGVDLGKAHNLFQVLNMLPSLFRIHLSNCELAKLLLPLVNLTNISPQLQLLNLRGNLLTLPLLDAFQNMTSLELLDLAGNNLNSVPSWLHTFQKLKYLDLGSSGLHGPIPYTFKNMTSIEFLSLSENSLTSVPCWLGEFNRLVHLDLSLNEFNHMECSMSSILTNLCKLKTLSFYGNKFGRKSIGDSKLSGCITYDLKNLYLSQNEFGGPFPTWLRRLENLEYLDLGSNFFYGPIPSLGNLSKLTVLDLSNNTLDGNLPDNFGQLVSLTSLYLPNNNFNGSLPPSLGQLTHLETLDLSGNKLHGNIPNDFDKLGNLSYLDLSSNKLDGIIPVGKEWSSIMTQLWFLNLSYNHIKGPLPRNIGNIMPNLGKLLLRSNLINGSIPNSLCQIQFYNLDISKNKLSGQIPNCWRVRSPFWKEINLSSNKLSGVFPSSFWNISSLIWLHLNKNNLQGKLPVPSNPLYRLLILDLGENQLSGCIPLWITNSFPSLYILRLRQNMLSGSIPSQLCQLELLHILDLSRNNLEGSIPQCIGNLRGMARNSSFDKTYPELGPAEGPITIVEGPIGIAESPITTDDNLKFQLLGGEAFHEDEWYDEDVEQVMKGTKYDYIKILKLLVNMDLSENKLVGFIPNGITLLTELQGLNLSHNHLEGEIPMMIGDMKLLESFDVSHNQLSGSIPNSMPSLTFLSLLNLSYNNFSGPIPIGNQFSTYDSSVYAENPYLCGHELPNKCPGDDSGEVPGRRGYEDDDEDGKRDKVEKLLFYFVIAVGFATGFWGVIGILLLKKSWRYACFRWVEDAADNIYVAVIIKVAKVKKWLVRNHVDY